MKKTLIIIALATLITISNAILAMPISNAQPPLPKAPMKIQTYPYLVITPNPVGVNQNVSLVMWLHGAPPSAYGMRGDRYQDFTIEITTPSLTIDTLGPFVSDATGSKYTHYNCTEIGQYQVKFSYSGQTINEPTIPFGGFDFTGCQFLPSSTTRTFIVQQDPVPTLTPTYPLPTEYWTRPIEGQNADWWKISSNWLAGAHIGYRYGHSVELYQPDGIAPNSPHIMWTKPLEFGGVVGGTTAIPGIGYYSGNPYEGRLTNAIIMYGRLYYQVPLYHAGGAQASGVGYACVDLYTGETIWISDEIGIPYEGEFKSMADMPSFKGQLYNYESMNQHGVVGGLIWTEYKNLNMRFVEVDGGKWMAYDANTGRWVYNITDVPAGTEVYTESGEIER
ncbi:MAG: hypothetical protein NWE80_04910, partial [Candidatus Bathyarchaeota archaeon]|nr:hypothetical protein [Candidatus Bathyarchaeota archaeon]